MEEKVHNLMNKMQDRHLHMKAAWYGPVLSPLLLVAGVCLLVFGIIILPTPAPGWLCIFIALGILSLVHPPTRRLTIWLASKLDIFFAWCGQRHPAVRTSLVGLLILFMVLVMGGTYLFIAPAHWPSI
ncbi:TIGR02611 family protein [Corynebacterium diphtheriae]|uniref:TIGR02611 family protein n=1 Tax=Corynebacterium diphtheriae TaxID=1717 RepID=UPI0015F3D7B5